MQLHGPVHLAVKRAYERFTARTGVNAVDYLASRLDEAGSTIYQWSEANGDDARRRISAAKAVQVTNELNAELERRGLPLDFSILRAMNGAVGLLCIEPPAGVDIERTGIARTLDEFNDLVQAFARALANGRIEASELPGIRREAFEVMEAVQALVAEAEAQAVDDEPAPGAPRGNGRHVSHSEAAGGRRA